METQDNLNKQTLPSTGTAKPTTEEIIATAEKAALELWKESILQAMDAMFQKAALRRNSWDVPELLNLG
jgi:hypothetical protein